MSQTPLEKLQQQFDQAAKIAEEERKAQSGAAPVHGGTPPKGPNPPSGEH